jgi:hypothetical protein
VPGYTQIAIAVACPFQRKYVVETFRRVVLRHEEEQGHFLDAWLHFNVDCYNLAFAKACKTRHLNYAGTVTPRVKKKYKAFQVVSKKLQEAKVDPFAFYSYTIRYLQNRKISPVITNICTARAVTQFLQFAERQKYATLLLSQVKTFLGNVYNSFKQDLDVFSTFRLRSVGSTAFDASTLFSEYSLTMLYYNNLVPLPNSTLYEDLEFCSETKEAAISKWNTLVNTKMEDIGSMITAHTQTDFTLKVQVLLETLKGFIIGRL